MTTTVAVDERTHQRLGRLKERWGLSSYDEVLRRLLDDVEDVPDSMFGSAPDLKPLTSKERRAMWDEEEHYDQGRAEA